MKAADFDFPFPENLIAKKPASDRDSAKLMVVHRNSRMEHREFRDLHEYLFEGDMLVLNNTKVFPARLIGIKPSGGRLDFILVKETEKDTWHILSRGKYTGIVNIAEGFSAEIKKGDTARFQYSGNFMENLWKYGNMPLPPYIKRKPEPLDKVWYQTVYAANQGSIAAPTAGMHFTQNLLKKIQDKGVHIRHITLHVGTGTFIPIKSENVKDHVMLPEYFEIKNNLTEECLKIKNANRRVICVGTTTTRAMEGYMSGKWQPVNAREETNLESSKDIRGHTDIFIYPGYKFRAVDSLITNFHLPCSTPLMLTAALCGIEKLKAAYSLAIAGKYRFFSYGDAMLIL